MVTATPIHPEGRRYAAPALFLPGLWSSPRAWRAAATFLGHRGWEGSILDLRALPGGHTARAEAVAEFVRGLPAPPVVLAHDGAALVALALARLTPVQAIVLVAPLVPGTGPSHAYAWSWGLVWALVSKRRCAPPRSALASIVFADLSPSDRADLGPEDPRILGELARPTPVGGASPMPPCLVVAGASDPLLPPDDAGVFAARIGADRIEVAGGHWLLAGPTWQPCASAIHRWLVQRGGAPLLELYEEAMAERAAADDDQAE
jgi:pimeloyl-ACP methyl ester carboxylesterase